MPTNYSIPAPIYKSQSNIRRLPYAKISAWCVQHLNNAQRLVVEGIFCELAVGESAIATSAHIARWANVSEATVSRALPGLAAKGLIALSRVYYNETGRMRWSLRHLPAQPDGSYAPTGSDMDGSPTLVTPQPTQLQPAGSDMDANPTPVVPDSGVQTPESGTDTISASGRLTSMSDPPIFYDSESPNKHARMLTAYAEQPHSRTRQTSTATLPSPSSRETPSETPRVLLAFDELRQRDVYAHSATLILKHHPTMTGAAFDRLLEQVISTRNPANPVRYLSGILQRGEMLDPPSQRAVLPPRRKVSNLPIIIAPVDATVKDHWAKIFALAHTDDERREVLDRFAHEVMTPARAAIQGVEVNSGA